MDAKTAIKTGIDTGNMISTSYLGDLTDEEMMHRPHPDCNHIKWQMGHLIASEHMMWIASHQDVCRLYQKVSLTNTPNTLPLRTTTTHSIQKKN